MKFTKMHGLGNDYVYVDAFSQTLPDDLPDLARRVSDRHFGIGSDGLILLLPSHHADLRMRMFNADGSEGEMCGNGVRCVAKYAHDHGIAPKPQISVETGRGVLQLDIERGPDGRAHQVRVDMGPPLLNPASLPSSLPGPLALDILLDPSLLDPDGQPLRLTAVSMGNPHIVAFVPDVAAVPLESLGPKLENHPAFPRRTNVHFAQVLTPAVVRMRTWERGSGATLACGTGACAVAVAGVLTGRTDRKLLAHLPGGDLTLEWPDDQAPVFMTGPATEVFSGTWPAP